MTERVDRFLRGFDRASYDRIKRAAQARNITIPVYIERLAKLHEAILKSEQHQALNDYGLGRVTD